MKKILILTAFIVMAVLLFSGCKADEAGIIDKVWQWEKFQSMDDSEIIVDDPSSYTLVFNKDGSINLQADCNVVLGEYTMEDSSLSIVLGPTTLAYCGDESLDNQYLSYLEDVVTYVLSEGKLYLNLKYDSGDMVFEEAGKK